MNVPSTRVVFPGEDVREILSRIELALARGQLAQGSNVAEFERSFADFVGARHAVAVNSGGAALEILFRSQGVVGKEVVVPVNTFLATASAVWLAGGVPVLADIDPGTMSPALEHIQACVTSRTVGVVLVHIGGVITPEIQRIANWCRESGLWLIEDCAHAHGSRLEGLHAGNFGIAGAFSFFATKVMTSGEGGMIVTNDATLAGLARVMRDYGKPDPWTSYHVSMGANWRMNELEAAVGVVQLKRLNEFLRHRKHVAELYAELLEGSAVKLLTPAGDCSFYKVVAMLPPGCDKKVVRAFMKKEGVSLAGGVYDVPLHMQPVFEQKVESVRGRSFPGADEFCERHLCLPVFYGMTDDEVRSVVKSLMGALVEAGV